MRVHMTTIVAALSALALGTAFAAQKAPYLSVPSGLAAGQEAVVSGGGFAPNTTVAVHVLVPHGVEYVDPVKVGPDGRISYVVTLSHPGPYVTKVFDTSHAQPLARTTIVAGSK